MTELQRKTPAAGQASGGTIEKQHPDDTTPHPYLERKMIDFAELQAACHCEVYIDSDQVAIEGRDPYRGQFLFRELVTISGERAGFERILPERIEKSPGDKPNDKFTTQGSQVSGAFTPIGFSVSELMQLDRRVIVCAGLADGYRIHEATGEPVACGVGEANICSVVEAIRQLNNNILVAVDNDDAGRRAGVNSGAPWTRPNHCKDWSDLYQSEGAASVADEISSHINSPGEDDPYGLQAATVGDLLDSEPPAREWLVTDRLPLGVVGLLAAAGGTGKSMATLQLAFSVCTGLPWLEMPMDRSGAVLIFSAEDDRDEIHRRLRTILRLYSDDTPGSFEPHRAAVARNLYIWDRVGQDNRLTEKLNGVTGRTALVNWIVNAAQQVPDLALIVLDPLARFDGGDPNDNADSTRLIECAEQIRKATGATVLLPHHVNKGSLKDSASGQEAVRGGSGLVDGSRWVGLLAGLRADQAKKDYGIDPDEAGQYVRFTTPKANYSAPWEGTWLRRLAGGALVPCELQAVQDTEREQKAQDRYEAFLVKAKEMIRKAVQKNDPLTARKLRAYGGTAGVFGMGDHMLRGCIKRAIEEGDIIKGFDHTLRLG
jgi:RecA-family ATPase